MTGLETTLIAASSSLLCSTVTATVVLRVNGRTKIRRDEHETLCNARLKALHERIAATDERLARVESKLDRIIEHLSK